MRCYNVVVISIKKINTKNLVFEIHVRRAAGRGYSQFHLSKSTRGEHPVEDIPNFTCIRAYLLVYVCHVSWPNEKRYMPEI